MKNKNALLTSFLLLIVSLVCIVTVFAHSGRTDGSGGHRDNKNASGLGSYHYHCGGYPPHLHTNGICPYKSEVNSSSNATSSSVTYEYNGTPTNKYDEGYDDGYELGREKGREEGYSEGHRVGYDEGYDEGCDNGYEEGYNVGYEEGYDKGFDKLSVIILIFILAIVIIVRFVKFINNRRKE